MGLVKMGDPVKKWHPQGPKMRDRSAQNDCLSFLDLAGAIFYRVPFSVTATRLDQLVYSPNYYIQIFRLNNFARSED